MAGTAWPKRGWLPTEITIPESVLFNDIFYCIYEDNTLCVRWIDNNVEILVSTVHKPHDVVLRSRRRPRITSTNRNNVSLVWNNNPVWEISIPRTLDNYNNGMNGVGIADQRIANYFTNFRCKRNWITLMIHSLNITRNNYCIIYRNEKSNRALTQKQFFLLEYLDEFWGPVMTF